VTKCDVGFILAFSVCVRAQNTNVAMASGRGRRVKDDEYMGVCLKGTLQSLGAIQLPTG